MARWGRGSSSDSNASQPDRAARRAAARERAEARKWEVALQRQKAYSYGREVEAKVTHEEQLEQYSRLEQQCRRDVKPYAVGIFASGLGDLPPWTDEEYLPTMWSLHMESIVRPYTQYVDEDLRTMPLVIMKPWEPGRLQEVDSVFGWWFDLLGEQAELCSMDPREFGDQMTTGFALTYNLAVRRFNSTAANTPSFHQFTRMSPADQARLAEERDRAEVERSIATNFCLAYGFAFRPSLAAEVLRNGA
jgi:hypothetical protein